MGLFICSRCNCVENTALGWWWSRDHIRLILPDDMKQFEIGHGLCTECLPAETRFVDGSGKGIGTGKWHDRFPKRNYDEFKNSEEGKHYVRQGNYLQYIK